MVWVDSQCLIIHLHFLDVCELLKVPLQIHLKKFVGINKTTDVNLTIALRNVLDT